ncbi:MAG: BatD family protein, partial [Candidatus Muiribacteriaceae bacterium]
MIKTGRLTTFFLLIFIISVHSATTAVLTVNDSNPSVNDVIRITLEITSDKSPDYDIHDFKENDYFKILPGNQTYSRTNIINFRAEYTRGSVFRARILKPGEFTLGPVRVDVEGKTIESNSVRITVGKNSDKSSSEDRNLICYQSFEPSRVVQGEQVSYRLVVAFLKNGRVREPRLNPTDKLDGFIQGEIIEKQGQKVIDGRPYIINEYRIPLIPLKSGVIRVDDVNVEYKYV